MRWDELQVELGASGTRSQCELDAGVHEVTATLRIGRSNVHVRGVTAAGECLTVLRRGRLADGSFYLGPLLCASDQQDIEVSDLVFDGARFEHQDEGRVDWCHPLTQDRRRAEYPCGKRLPAPECFEPKHFGVPAQADFLIAGCHRVSVHELQFRNSLAVALAIGRGCRDVVVHQVKIQQAGHIGLWLGAALAGPSPGLPLPAEIVDLLPCGVVIEACLIEESGAAGVHVEARRVRMRKTTLKANHVDFPFNEGGGQLIMDYKSAELQLVACQILDGPFLERQVRALDASSGIWSSEQRLLATVGIEANGNGLHLVDCQISGNAREGIHLNGSQGVTIEGARTRIAGNQEVTRRLERAGSDSRHGISVTTTQGFLALGAYSADLKLRDIFCEGGVLVWSDGASPWRLDGLEISRLDTGDATPALVVGVDGRGESLRGRDWRL